MTKNELCLFLENYKRQIGEEAAKLMSFPMPELTEDLFALYEQNGNRLQYENVYFERRKFLTILGLQALLEKRQQRMMGDQLLRKLVEIIEDVCNEECWALPAHVSRKHPGWQTTVDLFSAETGQTLAELADRLRNDLPENIYSMMLENVERRIFHPFLENESGYGWEKTDHNWNAVCSGSIGSACLHLMREKPDILEPCLKRVCESLPYYIGGFAEDGTCMEGLGYFTYGMSYFVHFAQELYEYTDGQRDLLCGNWAGFPAGHQDKRARIAAFFSKCFFSDGRTVSFSDASSNDKFNMGLACALKRRFPQVQIPDVKQAAGLLEDNCYRFAFRMMDVFETEKYLEQSEPEASTQVNCHKLLDAQWCIANARNGVGFACKGGHNGEPHNHNDVGHFIYESSGVILFADLGAGEYTADYFSDGRYGILCNNSFGHSVPIIAGCGQQAGKQYGCRVFTVDEYPERCIVHAEFSGAYERGLLEQLRRQLCFSLEDGSLTARDEFILSEDLASKNADAQENLITQILPKVQENEILLDCGAVTAVLSIEGIHPGKDVMIHEFIHCNHSGQPEKVYAIRWPVDIKERKGCCAFTIKIKRL